MVFLSWFVLCEKNHDEVFVANVSAVENMAVCCERVGCRFIHLSTDFGLDRSFIHPVTTEEMNEVPPRPRYISPSIEKAVRELGYAPHSLEEGMEELKN